MVATARLALMQAGMRHEAVTMCRRAFEARTLDEARIIVKEYVEEEKRDTTEAVRACGARYARWLQEHGESCPVVDVAAEAGRTVDIPPEDCRAMVAEGIAEPDAREYWKGYNAVAAEGGEP